MQFTMLGFGLWQILIALLLFFSACMFWDCVKRDPNEFGNRFGFPQGNYDKLAWLTLIVLGFKLLAVPALAYYLIERNKKVDLPWGGSSGPEKDGKPDKDPAA